MFLLLAPVVPPIWEAVLSAGWGIGTLADMPATRWAIAGTGLVLLLIASWDLATLLAAKWSR